MDHQIMVLYGNSKDAVTKLASTIAKLLKERVSCQVYEYDGTNGNDLSADTTGWSIRPGCHIISAYTENIDMPFGRLIEHLAHRYGKYNVSCFGFITEKMQSDRNCWSTQLSKADIRKMSEEFDKDELRAKQAVASVRALKDAPISWHHEEKVLEQLQNEPLKLDIVNEILKYMVTMCKIDIGTGVLCAQVFKHISKDCKDRDAGFQSIARLYTCPGEEFLKYPEITKNASHIVATGDWAGRTTGRTPARIGKSDIYSGLYQIIYRGEHGNFMPYFEDLVNEIWDKFRYDLDLETIIMDRDQDSIGFENGILFWDKAKCDYGFSKYDQKNKRSRNKAHVYVEYEDSVKQSAKLTPQEKDVMEEITGIFGDRDLFFRFLGTCMRPVPRPGSLFNITGTEKSIQLLLDVIHDICWYNSACEDSSVNTFDKVFNPYTTVYVDNVLNGINKFDPDRGVAVTDFGKTYIPLISNHIILRFYLDTDEGRNKMDLAMFREPHTVYELELKSEVKAWKKLKDESKTKITNCLAALSAEHVLQSTYHDFDQH